MSKINLRISLRGLAMGIAEVIPGVSGGTIAFITGIYTDLIESIKAFDQELISMLLKGRFKDIWMKVNGWFLLSLMLGMVLGVVFGVLVITWLLEHYPEPLWGFFLGLILASIPLLIKKIKLININAVLAFVAGLSLAISVILITPSSGSTNYLYIFFAGIIAISAFMLPGVSGSFMLLLLGLYTTIISALKRIITDLDLSGVFIIGVFALGCAVGIVSTTRLLSYMFKKFEDITLALLTGFLAGSLIKIWPWRNIDVVIDKLTGAVLSIQNLEQWLAVKSDNLKIVKESLALPNDYWMSSPKVVLTTISFIVGFIIIIFSQSFDRASKK